MFKINYHSEKLSKAEKEEIFKIITQSEDITDIKLSSVDLDDEDCEHLAGEILANGKITNLDIAWGEFTQVGFTAIAESLQKAHNPVSLNLRYMPCDMTESLAVLLENNLLSGLVLNTNITIEPEGQQRFLAALSANKSLSSIEINEAIIGDNFEALIDIFKAHPSIKNIDLGASFYRNANESVLELLAIDKLDSFTKTHASCDNEYAIRLAQVISKTKNLKNLVMYYNDWSLDGIGHLLRAWNLSDSLRSLDIHTSNFDRAFIDKHNESIKQDLKPDVSFLAKYDNSKYNMGVEINLDMVKFAQPNMVNNFCKFVSEQKKTGLTIILSLDNNEVESFINSLENISTPLWPLDITSRNLNLKNAIKLLELEGVNPLIEKFDITSSFSEEIMDAIRLKLMAGIDADQLYVEYFHDTLTNMDAINAHQAENAPTPKDTIELFVEKLVAANNASPVANEDKQIIIQKTLKIISLLEGEARLAEVKEIFSYNPAIVNVIGGEAIGDFFLDQKDYESALQFFYEAKSFLKIAEVATKLDIIAKQQSVAEEVLEVEPALAPYPPFEFSDEEKKEDCVEVAGEEVAEFDSYS